MRNAINEEKKKQIAECQASFPRTNACNNGTSLCNWTFRKSIIFCFANGSISFIT